MQDEAKGAEKSTPPSLQSVTAGEPFLAHLKDLPPVARFSAFVIAIFIGIFGYIVVTGSATERLIALFGIIAIVLLAIIAAFLLQREYKKTEGKVVVDAPKSERIGGQVVRLDYELFVAAPMASLEDDDAIVAYRNNVIDVLGRIKQMCKFEEVFYAGYEADKSANFDAPAVALKKNVQRMRASKRFMLIYSENVPTSALVEVGMALGLGKPSVWFVKTGLRLPYLMRGAQGAAYIENFPPIAVYEFKDFDQIKHYVQTNGLDLFVTKRAEQAQSTQQTG